MLGVVSERASQLSKRSLKIQATNSKLNLLKASLRHCKKWHRWRIRFSYHPGTGYSNWVTSIKMPVYTRSIMKRKWMEASQVWLNPKISKIKSKSKAIMKPPSSAKFLKDAIQSPLKSKTKAIRKLPSSCVKFLKDETVIPYVYTKIGHACKEWGLEVYEKYWLLSKQLIKVGSQI